MLSYLFRSTGNVPNVIIDKGGKSDSDSDDDGFMAKDEEIEPVQTTHQVKKLSALARHNLILTLR